MPRKPRLLTWRSTRVPRPFSIRATLHDAGAELHVEGLKGEYDLDFPTEVTLRVAGGPELQGVPGVLGKPGTLQLSADRWGPFSDPLFQLAVHATRQGVSIFDPDREGLVELLASVRRHLVRRCEPAARREAARYSSWSHWFLYRRLCADTSGRLLQAARALPGVVGWAIGMESIDRPDLAQRVFDGIESGLPARGLIDGLLRAQVSADPLLFGFEREAHGEAVAAWFSGPPFGRCPLPRVELHRQLLRRMGPEQPPFLYVEPPPAGLWPELLPRTRAERTAHRALRDRLGWAGVGHWPTPPRGFESLAVWLARHPRAKLDCGLLGGWLYAGGRLTQRTHLRTVRRVLAKLALIEPAVHAVAQAPSPIRPGFQFGADRLEPLLEEDSVRAEGAAQHNCLWHGGASDDDRTYYSGELAGERLTVKLSRGPDGRPRLHDVRRSANRRASPGVEEAVRRWAETGEWVRP